MILERKKIVDYYSLNDTHKKMAAIRSAAKNATNPVTAVADYMMSTGLADHVKAKEEMFSILPGYRHPVKDFIVEGWIFFAEFELDCVSNSWNTPDWFDELNKISSVPKLLLDQVWQYVKNSELSKIRTLLHFPDNWKKQDRRIVLGYIENHESLQFIGRIHGLPCS